MTHHDAVTVRALCDASLHRQPADVVQLPQVDLEKEWATMQHCSLNVFFNGKKGHSFSGVIPYGANGIEGVSYLNILVA